MTEEKYLLSDVIKDPVFEDTVLSFNHASLRLQRFQELKNGQIHIEDILDIQGLKTDAARKALQNFIELHAKKHERCMLIIFGKERLIQKKPPLKNLINSWLPQFKEVLAFHSAQAIDGGLEAVYVLLKREYQTDLPVRHPPKAGNETFLIAETKSMERSRRLAEQEGERQLASVKARNHAQLDEIQQSPEGELQNNILQHPELDSQRFDGIDPNLNPEPPLNSEARREFDNEKREQEMEKQLRLGNMPRFNSAPTPKGP